MATKKKPAASNKPAANKKPAADKAKAPPPRRSIVVTVDDNHLANIQTVAKQLRSRGMKVDDVLASIGIISGSAATAAAELRAIPGVAGVEEQTHFQLPPPDAPIK